MIAFGWIATGLRTSLASAFRRRRVRPARKAAGRVLNPGLESLEAIELMSRASLGLAAARAQIQHQPTVEAIPFTSQTISVNNAHAMTAMQTSQTTLAQTVTVPDTLTNFSQPFAPPIGLFNPSLGQLVAVHISATATLTSQIRSENTSTTSGADITGFTDGNFSIDGLTPAPITGELHGKTATVSVPPFAGGPIDFTGPSSVTFPPLTSTTTKTIDVTDPAQLAFYVASAGRTTIDPTLTANATAGANAPNGNLRTEVRTTGSGSITVTYEYIPQCPPVTGLVRFGIHHQPTRLVVTFGGPLPDVADATDPANYVIVARNARGTFTGPGTRTIPVTSAVYDPNTNSVTLTPARPLNVHQQFQLRITLPCNNGNPIVIQFGGKKSLGGFDFHGRPFTVVNGQAFPS